MNDEFYCCEWHAQNGATFRNIGLSINFLSVNVYTDAPQLGASETQCLSRSGSAKAVKFVPDGIRTYCRPSSI